MIVSAATLVLLVAGGADPAPRIDPKSGNVEVDVEEAEPFKEEEKRANEDAARREREAWEKRNRLLEETICKNGFRFHALTTDAWARLRWSVSAAGWPPNVFWSPSVSWTAYDANWTCNFPTQKQLDDAGWGDGHIDWAIPPPRYQLALAAGGDALVEGRGTTWRIFARAGAGAFLLGGYPSVDLSIAAGPTFGRDRLGFGISAALALWGVELGARLQIGPTPAWFLTAGVRDFQIWALNGLIWGLANLFALFRSM